MNDFSRHRPRRALARCAGVADAMAGMAWTRSSVENSRGPGSALLRAGGRIAALGAVAAMLATGCGSPAGGQAGSLAYQKALPFAQCMRSHGIGNFSDPDSNGNFPNGNIQDTPQYAKAQSTCVKLHPYNMVLSPQQVTKMMAQAVKYARCMRAHGVPDFPDPTDNGSGIAFGGQTSGGSPPGQGGSAQPTASTGKGGSAQPTASTSIGTSGPSESPQYQAADQACRSYMTGAK